MFRPLSLFIGLRYTRAKRRNHFISFIAFTSMIGIALGVMVLITVLSVMNGFDEVIQNRIFSMASEITISKINNQPFFPWRQLAEKISKQNKVEAVAPYVNGQGLLLNGSVPHPVIVYGVAPSLEKKVSNVPSQLELGKFQLLPGTFKIVIGEELAQFLGVNLGDKINLITPSLNVTPFGASPRSKSFIVQGIYQVGKGFGEGNVIYINIQDAQTLYQLGNNISGLRLKVTNFFTAPQIAENLGKNLPPDFQTNDWTQTFGSLLYAISLEKTMMFFILLLLIAIAAFNLVSSLMMIVTDKQADIAILRTLGATPRTILLIFIVQGWVIGFFGMLLGLVGGLLIAFHVSEILQFIENIFHVQLFTSDVYFYVNQLPSKVEFQDVCKVSLAALGMSLFATIYPAWRAARTAPVEALRYE